MSQSACSMFLGADRSATDPQSRQLAFKPCRRFLGRLGLGSRLQQFIHQVISPLALALEVCPISRYHCFDPRDLSL